MNAITRWTIRVILIVAIGYGAYYFFATTEAGQGIVAQLPFEGNEEEQPETTRQRNTADTERSADQLSSTTIAIQPAGIVFGDVSAAGNIELSSEHSVVAEVDSTVTEIAVDTGDSVAQGDLLVRLNTVELERAVQLAELNVKTSQNDLAQLLEETGEADIAVAAANLVEAQENRVDVIAGPSDVEIAAAKAGVSSSWAKYNELLAGASDAVLTQLSAELRKMEVTVAEAQRAYNEIAWKNDSAATTQAAALQQATIDYESVVASYEEATAPAATSEIQSAYSSAQGAQSQLDALLNSPTTAETASAESAVVDAQATLDQLLNGPTDTELEKIRITLEKALIELEKAHNDLAKAIVTAPIDGAVISVSTEIGKRVEEGSALVSLTDPTALELTIEVAEIDIPSVYVGQPATILIDAFPGKTYAGTVESVSFTSDSESGIVTYPVTIQLEDGESGEDLAGEDLAGVLPGMTAVATLSDMDATAADGWLVPANSIRDQGDGPVVMVVTGDQTSLVPVTTGEIQGEWIAVYSPDLAQGDSVLGSVSSFISDEDEEEQLGPSGAARPPGGAPPGAGGGGRN